MIRIIFVPSIVSIAKDFHIEAAHFLPYVSHDHQCHSIHGHSYTITLKLKGPIDEKQGWLVDLRVLSDEFEPLKACLDHALLNNIDGLENPTSENLAIWILRKLQYSMPLLDEVRVKSTHRLTVSVKRKDID